MAVRKSRSSTGRSGRKSPGSRPAGKSGGKSGGKSAEKSAGKSGGKPGGKSGDRKKGGEKAGAQRQFPPQTQERQPGRESEMRPRPDAEDPGYRGSGKLRGKAALITGGDSGIGRAVAILYAREGADVAISYLEEHRDAEETKRLVEEEGGRCVTIAGDIGDEGFCRTLVERTVRELGRLDIVVNNAAEQHPQERLEDVSAKQLERTFRTNIFSFFHVTKAALAHLGEGGVVVNTTSVTAYRGSPKLLDYSSTKGAIVSFTRSLALSLVERGIRVNAVAPGPIWTPLIPSTFDEEKHLFAIAIAKQQPALQQVLVVTIDRAADVTIRLGPFAGFDVDPFANKANLRAPFESFDEGAFSFLVVNRLTGELAERAKLDQQRSRFRGIADRLTRLARFEIDVTVGHPGRRVENRQESLAEIFREVEQTFVAGHLVTAQQSAEQSDRDLEVLDFDVFIERKIVEDVFPGRLFLVRETHEDHRVERVNRRHQQRLRVPVVVSFGEWL
jgi:NAD(P)-dependent dehydrogenase (short-subunit alcohol dehydrogenase family)